MFCAWMAPPHVCAPSRQVYNRSTSSPAAMCVVEDRPPLSDLQLNWLNLHMQDPRATAWGPCKLHHIMLHICTTWGPSKSTCSVFREEQPQLLKSHFQGIIKVLSRISWWSDLFYYKNSQEDCSYCHMSVFVIQLQPIYNQTQNYFTLSI